MSYRCTAVLVPLTVLIALSGCNDPPGEAGIRIDPESPTTTDPLVLNIFEPSVDAQGHAITYEITWTRNSQPAPEFDGAETIPAEATARGEIWSVEVVPVDEKEEPGLAVSTQVTVLNTAPALVSAVFEPTSPSTVDDLRVVVQTEDADEDAVDISYAWSVDGTAIAESSDTLSASAFEKGQVVSLSLTLEDQADSTVVDGPSVTIANTPPEMTGATIDPSEARVADTLSIRAEGWADVDGDSPGYDYAWSVNGTEVGTAAELAGAFAKGDTVSCEVTPNDGEATGISVTTPDITVLNTPPVIGSVRLDDLAPVTDADLVATADAVVDADGDPVRLTFVWSIDGREVRRETLSDTTDTLPAAATSKGQRVEVVVTPNDGDEDGLAVSSAVAEIQNTPPVMTTVTLSPTSAYTDSTLEAAVAATDADGDALTYSFTWTNDGATVGGSGSTLDSSTFKKGDAISVSVVANDGDDDSVALAAGPLTILNSPPSAPSDVEITPEDPTSDDDLICEIGTASTDKDGDRISYTYVWYRDGVKFKDLVTTSPSVTLRSTDTAEYDEWECGVTASDGTATATEVVSDPVEIIDWTGPRSFTTCGAAARMTGPTSTECTSAYSGTTLAGEVSVASGIQSWTVPKTGTYRIEAYGAKGGGAKGGSGARIRGDFKLTEGTTLYVIVGQEGGVTTQASYYVGGGGGGSYVYTNASATTPLLVAGGGGGQAESCSRNPAAGGNGSATTTPLDSASGSVTNPGTGNGAGGSGGNGGKRGNNISRLSTGAGGGGWLSDGETGLRLRSPGGIGGEAPRNGAEGGKFGHASFKNADGGFGGGGGASDNTGAGGGGGGYNGGGGGNNYAGLCPPQWGAGGGAGSYNGGTNQSNSSGANAGNGKVTIDLQ